MKMKILSGLTTVALIFLFQLSETQVKATEDVEATRREFTNYLSLIRQSTAEFKDNVAALQAEYAKKVLSINVSITSTQYLVTEIRPGKLADAQIFFDEAIVTVFSVNVTIDHKLQVLRTDISNLEIEVSSIAADYEARTNHEEDLYDYLVTLIIRLNATNEVFKAVEDNYIKMQTELESLINALKLEIENVITSIYDAVGITSKDLSLYLQNRITHLYNASCSEYYEHESALTDTYYYVRGYVLHNFNIYNNVDASFETAYKILNEGLNVIIVSRSGTDNSVFNSTLNDFRNKINTTREHFNAYLDNLLGRAFNIDTILRHEILKDSKRLNITVNNMTCDNIVTFIEMNACFVKIENDYLDFTYKIVWLVNEHNDLKYKTVDKGRVTYQTEYSNLITYRNGLLEAQFVSHNITVTDINDYATQRITFVYNEGYNEYTNRYYPSVESEAKILFARNDLLNLITSGVTTALQNATTQALKDSLKTVVDKVNYVYKTNYDSIVKQLMQFSKYFYVDTLQWYKTTALNYKCSTVDGINGTRLLVQTLEVCALTKIDIFTGNKSNLDRGVLSLLNTVLAFYRDYDVYLNVRIYVHPAISQSLTLAPVNSSVYNGLNCFYDTDYRSCFMFGIDVVPETYKKCYSMIIAP